MALCLPPTNVPVGAPSRFSCEQVIAWWGEAEQRKRDGKKCFHGLSIDRWFDKWRNRYLECTGQSSVDTSTLEAIDTFGDQIDQSEEDTRNLLATLEANSKRIYTLLAVTAVLTVLFILGYSYVKR